MPDNALVLFLQIASIALTALTVGKLLKNGLWIRYRVFFWYIVFRVFAGLWPLFIPIKSDLYAYVWAFELPVSLVFYVWVVLELCRMVLEKHRGLYTLGRWAMFLGMIVSVTLSVLSLIPRIRPNWPQRSKYMGYILATDRGVTFCMAVFLLLMLFLISRYPVRLSRNVVLHAALYTVFFLSNTLGVILMRVFGVHLYGAIDNGLLVVSCLCILAWFLFLTPKGEESSMQIPHFRPEHEERLLGQLDAINSTMLKLSRN